MSFDVNSFNWLDYTFLSIFIISILLGLRRGFVKEAISIVTWIAAFFIASTFAGNLAALFGGSSSYVDSLISAEAGKIGVSTGGAVNMLMTGGCFIVLFIGTLIAGSIVSYIMTSVAEIPGISFINRILGALFGFARGFMVNLIIIFIVQLTSVAQQPAWAQSQFVQAFQPSVTWLQGIVQPGYQNLKAKMGQSLQGVGQQISNYTQ